MTTASLEQNLDAYRILAQILMDLRAALMADLEKHYGEEWYRAGFPQPVLTRLIERKEHEQTIDWYESEYQQLIDFASFEDILEIVEADSKLLPALRALAPSAPLLHARLMEMEVMREKIALARTIGENELVFLGTFHLRFRKVMEGQSGAEDGAVRTPQPVQLSPSVEESGGDTPSKRPAVEPPVTPPPDFQRSATTPPVDEPSRREPAIPPEPEAQADEEGHPSTNGKNSVVAAMNAGEDRSVLDALYREVTSIAEGLWERDVPAPPAVWPKVREHAWYEKNFSRMGLKPLSDFYDVIDKVHTRMQEGLAKDELQSFLKEHNFAKILLALRDMFQKNQL